MKFKDSVTQYWNDLPNKWSANFLALLGGTNFIFVLICVFIATFHEAPSFSSITNFIDFLGSIIIYSIALFIISSITAAYITIPYILMIASKKHTSVIINFLIILSLFITIFATHYKALEISGGVGFFILYLLFADILAIPILVLIYTILLIIEHFSKFRIPESLFTKNPIFEKYIKFFYCYTLLIIFSLLVIGLYILIT